MLGQVLSAYWIITVCRHQESAPMYARRGDQIEFRAPRHRNSPLRRPSLSSTTQPMPLSGRRAADALSSPVDDRRSKPRRESGHPASGDVPGSAPDHPVAARVVGHFGGRCQIERWQHPKTSCITVCPNRCGTPGSGRRARWVVGLAGSRSIISDSIPGRAPSAVVRAKPNASPADQRAP